MRVDLGKCTINATYVELSWSGVWFLCLLFPKSKVTCVFSLMHAPGDDSIPYVCIWVTLMRVVMFWRGCNFLIILTVTCCNVLTCISYVWIEIENILPWQCKATVCCILVHQNEIYTFFLVLVLLETVKLIWRSRDTSAELVWKVYR